MTRFSASGASTGRNAKAQRICLSCLLPADLSRGVLSARPPTKNTCHCGGKIERFDSKAEMRRYIILRLRERDEEIFALKVHPKYDLLVSPYDYKGHERVKIGSYTADFEYAEKDPALGAVTVIEDVKPMRLVKGKKVPMISPETKLRIKLFEALYGRKVKFVE